MIEPVRCRALAAGRQGRRTDAEKESGMKIRNPKHNDDWKTPQSFYDALNAEFQFQFDPCPYRHSMEWDGLTIDWSGRNFVNPPYSRKLKEAFVRKAIEESKKGKLCVVLLPVYTSTALFHDWIKPYATEIRFVRARVLFEGFNMRGEHVDANTGSRPQHDSMLVIFDGRESKPRAATDGGAL